MKNKYYAIFGVLFLLLSLGGAYYLANNQNADNRNLATKGGDGTAKNKKSDYDLRQEQKIIDKLEAKVTEAAANPNASGPGAALDKLNDAISALSDAKKAAGSELPFDEATCTGNGGTTRKGYWCGTCGGFCSSGDQSCDAAGIAKCNEYPQRGGSYSKTEDSTYKYKCNCTQGTYYFDKPGVCNFPAGSGSNQVQSDQVSTNGGDAYLGYSGTEKDGLCHIVDFTTIVNPTTGQGLPAGYQSGYWCPGKFDNLGGGCQDKPIPANFNYNCFCGTIQIDTAGKGFTEKTMKCGCATSDKTVAEVLPTPTTPVIPTNTPPKVPTSTPVPVRFGCGYSPCNNSTSPCSSGLVCIAANNNAQYCSLPQYVDTCATNPGYAGCCTSVVNTPTPTPTTPVITNTPTPTPTIGYLACGYTPCDNGSRQCTSGLTCITANNSNQYCSRPELTAACKVNPGYVGCCTVPLTPTSTGYITQGPSPTRIILPVSGVEFPVQALTIVGGIATLLGFLILL